MGTPREVVEEFYRRAMSGDLAGAHELLADDAMLVEPVELPYGGVWRGRAGWERSAGLFAATWKVAFDDGPEFFGNGVVVACRLTLALESFRTGAAVKARIVEVVTVADQRIARMEVLYADVEAATRALGDRSPLVQS